MLPSENRPGFSNNLSPSAEPTEDGEGTLPAAEAHGSTADTAGGGTGNDAAAAEEAGTA